MTKIQKKLQAEIISQTEKFRPNAKYPVYPPYHKNEYLEEYFFEYFLKNHIKTDRLYLPIFWTNLYCNETHNNEKFDIQSFLDSLDQNAKYFTICQHEAAPREKLPKNTLIFSASGKIHQSNKSNNHIAIPLICSQIENKNLNKKRDILCSFVGASTHKLRTAIYDQYKNDSDFYINIDTWRPDVPSHKEEEFKTITERSIFTLCPRGDGPTSFRLYEAMQLGSIPVYVHDMLWLPFSDKINWKDICVFITENEIPHLKDILTHISNERRKTMLKNIKSVYKNFFTLEKMCFHIHDKLKNEKTRLITFYSDSHESLYHNYFLPTVKKINEYDLISYKTKQVGNGSYYNENWKQATGEKIKILQQTINECWGDVFVFSDIDIIFFDQTKYFLLKQIKKVDAVFQRDNSEICTGFFMMKCNESTLNFIDSVLKNYDKYQEDQDAANQNKHLIKYKLLPDEIFNIGMVNGCIRWCGETDLNIPENILLFHANWTVGIENKIELFNFVIDKLKDKIDYRDLKINEIKKNSIMFSNKSFFVGEIRNDKMKNGFYISNNDVEVFDTNKRNKLSKNISVNVFFNFYRPNSFERSKEIEFCFSKLVENNEIDRLFVLYSDNENNFLKSKNLFKIYLNKERPTFKDFFNIINFNTDSNDVNIILNSDCFIDEENVKLIKTNIKENQVYCLSRWDLVDINKQIIKHYDIECSQDAWVFKGMMSEKIEANYKMGIPGCDNAIAHEFNALKYIVLNPSRDIKIFHLHLSNIRNYNEEQRIRRPYLFVIPDKLQEAKTEENIKIIKIEDQTIIQIPEEMTGKELKQFKENQNIKNNNEPRRSSHGMDSAGGVRP